MRPRCDVLVLGGGPAGIAAALTLQRKGLQVVVLERTGYEVVRPGEWLLGASRPLMMALGVWEQFSTVEATIAPPILSVWGDERMRLRPPALDPHGHGWFVDRTWFDATLARAAESSGALVYCNLRPAAATRVRHGWRIALKSGEVQAEVEARYVVDATGRAAWMARRMSACRHVVDKLVAFVGRYEHAPNEPTLLVEAVPEGWWYSVPVPGDHTLAVYLTDGDYARGQSCEAFYRARLTATDHTLARVASLGEPSIRIVPASTYKFDHCTGDHWLSVGDAAFAIDPLSGSGIARALESGLRAAKAIAAFFDGAESEPAIYQRDTAVQFAAQLQARRHYYGLECRWPSSLFWSRRRN